MMDLVLGLGCDMPKLISDSETRPPPDPTYFIQDTKRLFRLSLLFCILDGAGNAKLKRYPRSSVLVGSLCIPTKVLKEVNNFVTLPAASLMFLGYTGGLVIYSNARSFFEPFGMYCPLTIDQIHRTRNSIPHCC